MADSFSNRIGSKAIPVGRGSAPTVQDIADLNERQRQAEKKTQPKPTKPFSSYLEKGQQGDAEDGPEDPNGPPEHDGAQDRPRRGPTTRPALGGGKRIIRG